MTTLIRTIEDINEEQRERILQSYVDTAVKRRDRPYKATSEQRAIWNKKHYENRKLDPKFAEKRKDYYEKFKEDKKERAKYDYYRKIKKLDLLKERYPTIYAKYIKIE